MPIYAYRCEGCRHEFELRQGFDAEPMTDCPRCGSLAKRRITSIPVIFKGSGWYVTDYSRRGSTAEGNGHSSGGPSEAPKEPSGETSKTSGEASKTGEHSKPGEP